MRIEFLLPKTWNFALKQRGSIINPGELHSAAGSNGLKPTTCKYSSKFNERNPLVSNDLTAGNTIKGIKITKAG